MIVRRDARKMHLIWGRRQEKFRIAEFVAWVETTDGLKSLAKIGLSALIDGGGRLIERSQARRTRMA
jgi:hypothetical protein